MPYHAHNTPSNKKTPQELHGHSITLGVHWVCETQTKPTIDYTACVIERTASSNGKYCVCTTHITGLRGKGQTRRGLHLIEVVHDAKQRHWWYIARCQV